MHDLVGARNPPRPGALRAALETTLRRNERERGAGARRPAAALSADTLQKLGALGYVSPGAGTGAAAQGADPKDKIDEFSTLNGLMRDGLTLLRDSGSSPPALPSSPSCGRRAPTASRCTSTWAGALAGLGRRREAEDELRRAPPR